MLPFAAAPFDLRGLFGPRFGLCVSFRSMLAFRGNFGEGGLAPLAGESVCGFSFASLPGVAHCFDSSSLISSIVDPGEGGGAGWGVAMTAPDQFKGENGCPVKLGIDVL